MAVIATAAAGQIARLAADLVGHSATSAVSVFAREGTDPHRLAMLVVTTADLIPDPHLLKSLDTSQSFEGTWTSRLMANFMGTQQETTQSRLLQIPGGRSLVLYVTALAAAETSITVRNVLREHLALATGFSQVAEVPESIYHPCVHPPTLRFIQNEIATHIERCMLAFSAVDTKGSKSASYREIAMISTVFSKAQKKGSKYFVRVKNLVGLAGLCAALIVAFNADVTVDFMHAGPSGGKTVHQRSNSPLPATKSAPESPMSWMTDSHRTRIQFEYDGTEICSIGLCEIGGSIQEHILSSGRKSRPSTNSMQIGQLLPSTKILLDKSGPLSWICKAALAVYVMQAIAKDMVDELANSENDNRQSMTTRIARQWMEIFGNELGGDVGGLELMQELLRKIAGLESNRADFEAIKFALRDEVELHDAGPDQGARLALAMEDHEARNSVAEILIFSLFRVLFGRSYTGLEVNINQLDAFLFPRTLPELVPRMLGLLPAYQVPVTVYRQFSICCSVVQCGGYALMPRILAEETLSGVDSSPFIMVPGQLAKDLVPVRGFYYDEQHKENQITDLRPGSRVPSDASDSDDVEYIYEEADFGYKFWTKQAGHRINLDGLVYGIILMHSTDDTYGDTASSTSWTSAAPHHMIAVRYPLPKILYLSFNNQAGRVLALSRAGEAQCISVVHFGRDYRQALAYAERHECNIVIV
jgi:hypothetical protein